MIWRALFPRGRIQGLDPRGVVLRACSREHDAQKAERAMSTRRRWVLHAEKGHAQTPDTAASASAAGWSTESFDTLHCSAEGNFGTPPELIISTDHTESVHSLGARARSRMPPRPLVRGRAGPAAQQAGPPVDPKLEVVAAWLRNEKRSGLYTKEAVQYEKVCAARASRPCERVACGLRWRHGMRSTYRPVHEPGDATCDCRQHSWPATPFLSSACAVAGPQRVEYFKGSKLVDTLIGPKYKGKMAKDMPIKTRAEAAKLAQELLRVGYIHRSKRMELAHTRRWELELQHGPFEDSKDALFTWVYEGAQPWAPLLPPLPPLLLLLLRLLLPPLLPAQRKSCAAARAQARRRSCT